MSLKKFGVFFGDSCLFMLNKWSIYASGQKYSVVWVTESSLGVVLPLNRMGRIPACVRPPKDRLPSIDVKNVYRKKNKTVKNAILWNKN